MSNDLVRWGFIGAGSIANSALKPAIENSEISSLVAVAARDVQRAQQLAPNARAYGSYDDLYADADVDAVYISLANDRHVPEAIKALEHGKHVLCEKPLGMNADEVRSLISVRDQTGLICVEASWNRWHPRTRRTEQLLAGAKIGAIKEVNASLTFTGLEPENFRNFKEMGGGAVYDLGPYALAAGLWTTNFPAISELRTQSILNAHGVDITTAVSFNAGFTQVKSLVSMALHGTDTLEIIGESGRIYLPGNRAFMTRNIESSLLIETELGIELEHFAPCDPYQLMLDSVSKNILGESSWVMPLSESLAFAELFDQVFAATLK